MEELRNRKGKKQRNKLIIIVTNFRNVGNKTDCKTVHVKH